MRICDIDRKSEVKYEGVSLADGDGTGIWEIEIGQPARDALATQDWAALAAMVPKDVSKKNPNRVAGAQKRLETIAKKKQAAAQADVEPPAEVNVQASAGTATAGDPEPF